MRLVKTTSRVDRGRGQAAADVIPPNLDGAAPSYVEGLSRHLTAFAHYMVAVDCVHVLAGYGLDDPA